LAGCPAGVPGEALHWRAYLPYLENIHERQWTDVVGAY
jgi:hypothetical protein